MRKIKEKVTLGMLKELAHQRDGECLSNVYVNAHTIMRWRCANGHEWETTANSIRRGSWCMTCSIPARGIKGRIYDIAYFQALAQKRGGECLSAEYTPRKPMKFKCSSGHVFERTPDLILYNRMWCPSCQGYRMEELCRIIFEQGFNEHFPRKNPGFMKYKTKKLQLDGYCENLGIAFEYQGEQHYSADTHFGGEIELKHRQELDAAKLELCKDAKIVLVQIPTIPKNATLQEIVDHVILSIPQSLVPVFHPENIHPEDFDTAIFDPVKKTVLSLIGQKKGKLVSIAVPSMTTRIVVECDKGHEFTTTGHRISRGRWCFYCCKNRKIPEADIKQIIEAKGGTFLERFRNGPSTRIRLQCSKGHIWDRSQTMIKNGYWCPKCFANNHEKKLELARTLAEKKGGISMATRCENSSHKIVWQCKEAHQFIASIDQIKNKHYWCPVCANSKRRMKTVVLQNENT